MELKLLVSEMFWHETRLDEANRLTGDRTEVFRALYPISPSINSSFETEIVNLKSRYVVGILGSPFMNLF